MTSSFLFLVRKIQASKSVKRNGREVSATAPSQKKKKKHSFKFLPKDWLPWLRVSVVYITCFRHTPETVSHQAAITSLHILLNPLTSRRSTYCNTGTIFYLHNILPHSMGLLQRVYVHKPASSCGLYDKRAVRK